MALNKAYVSSTQVASSTPFDNSVGDGYLGSDVQSALQELRDYTIYDSQTTATTLNGTLTLLSPVAGGQDGGSGSTSTTLQFLTGTATGFSVELPNATTLSIGMHYKIDNTSTQPVTIKDGSGATLFSLSQSSIGELTLQTNGTSAGAWVWWQTSIDVASGIISYNVVSSTSFATTSTTDVVITGFTVTPQAGTYAVWVNGTWTPQAGPGNVETVTIYKGGAAIPDSVRGISPVQSLNPALMCTQTITQVTGTQAIDVRINSSSGQTLTVTNRSLLLIRLGT
jgi:hypothetical protein